jgi:nitrogen-specific signal transduction histidine kinase
MERHRRAACAWWCRTSGTGFPEHILKRAFEPYVTTKAKGTGLGLAVVKKIADEHGSRIDMSTASRTAKWWARKYRYHSPWQHQPQHAA